MKKGDGTAATISWEDYARVELRAGRVVRAEVFPEARRPALKVWADFGPEFGVRKTSAQITAHYAPAGLVGRMVVGVLNFPPKQVGPFMSEFLLLGFEDESGAVVLAVPDATAGEIPLGAKLC